MKHLSDAIFRGLVNKYKKGCKTDELVLAKVKKSWNKHIALQRQNDENLKQIFPEKEYRGLSPNFHIHVCVSELYIPTMGLPFLLEEICGPILRIYSTYKSLTDT